MGNRGHGRGSDESGSRSKSRGGRCGGTALSARTAAARLWQQKPRRTTGHRLWGAGTGGGGGGAGKHGCSGDSARGVSADDALSGGYGGRHGAAGAAAEELDKYELYE